MANQIRIKRRASTGLAGAPSSLKNAELAYNEADNVLYYGYGDDGSGNATSIIGIAGSGNNVTITGTQAVSGDKTFSGTVDLTGTFQIDSTAVTATAVELNYTGDLGTFDESIIGDNLDVKQALQALESALTNANADAIDLRTMSGTPDGATDLGTFGGTIIPDNTTIKAALEELEAAVEDGSGSLTGDTGTADFASGTVTVAGGTGITTTGDNSSTLTVTLDDTAVTAGDYGDAAQVATFTVDDQGRLTEADVAPIAIEHTQVTDFDSGVQTNKLNELAQPDGDVSMNGQKITGLADPVNAQDAATKAYVDATASGLDVKSSVRVATTASITLSGTQTIDGIVLVAGDRVLVKDQSIASENGIYDVAAGAWARSSDADNTPSNEVSSGMFTFVEEGSANADAGFVLQTADPITLDITPLSFVQFSGAGQVIAGAGMSKSGNTLDVGTADTGRIVVNADNIDLATHGSAGTYNGLTVDAYGRVSSFAQPTTLAGYSISDAQPLDATLTALAGVTTAANQLIYATGSDTFAVTNFSSYGRTLVDDADAAAARTTLGLGTIATQDANNVSITGGSIDNIQIDGGLF